MRFLLSLELLEALRGLRSRRSGRDEVEEEYDAFLLDPGLGPVSYLTADGRVLEDGRCWDDSPIREADEDGAIAALVVGAKKTGIAALLDLIPSPPATALTCPTCSGARWILDQRLICRNCSGRGWVTDVTRHC